MKTTSGTTLALAVASLLLIQGCSSGGGSNDGDTSDGDTSDATDTTTTDTTDTTDATDATDATATPTGSAADFGAVAGLYDASFEEGDDLDEVFVEIEADGTYTNYDYQGDTFDQGSNCYSIASGRIESLGGDRYRVDAGGFEGEVTLVRSDEALTITYFDGESETWPIIVNQSSTDFNAC